MRCSIVEQRQLSVCIHDLATLLVPEPNILVLRFMVVRSNRSILVKQFAIGDFIRPAYIKYLSETAAVKGIAFVCVRFDNSSASESYSSTQIQLQQKQSILCHTFSCLQFIGEKRKLTFKGIGIV